MSEVREEFSNVPDDEVPESTVGNEVDHRSSEIKGVELEYKGQGNTKLRKFFSKIRYMVSRKPESEHERVHPLHTDPKEAIEERLNQKGASQLEEGESFDSQELTRITIPVVDEEIDTNAAFTPEEIFRLTGERLLAEELLQDEELAIYKKSRGAIGKRGLTDESILQDPVLERLFLEEFEKERREEEHEANIAKMSTLHLVADEAMARAIGRFNAIRKGEKAKDELEQRKVDEKTGEEQGSGSYVVDTYGVSFEGKTPDQVFDEIVKRNREQRMKFYKRYDVDKIPKDDEIYQFMVKQGEMDNSKRYREIFLEEFQNVGNDPNMLDEVIAKAFERYNTDLDDTSEVSQDVSETEVSDSPQSSKPGKPRFFRRKPK